MAGAGDAPQDTGSPAWTWGCCALGRGRQVADGDLLDAMLGTGRAQLGLAALGKQGRETFQSPRVIRLHGQNRLCTTEVQKAGIPEGRNGLPTDRTSCSSPSL